MISRKTETKKNKSNIILSKKNFDNKNLVETKVKPKFFLIKILFPLFPVKLLSSVYLMVFMGSLIAIRLILSQLSIPIVAFGFNISFSWLPVYICGFFFGPIIGTIFGVAMDSLTFAINGGIWFWMYAIQEPIIGLISGIIGASYLFNIIKSIKAQSIIQQVIIILFALFTIFIVIYQFYIIDGKFSNSGMTNVNIFAIISIIIMVLYICINEIQFVYFFKKNKNIKQLNFLSLYLHVSLLIIVVTILFSFMLGPITYAEYTKYITGSEPSSFIKYGSMYYLVPRVLKESIKTPIYIVILFGIILAIQNPIKNFINLTKNSW